MMPTQDPTAILGTLPDAPLWRRLMAMVYDTFLLFGISMAYGYIVVFVEASIFGTSTIESSPTAAGNPLVFAGWISTITLFFCFFWLRNGQTLGMQVWRLQVLSANGQPLSIRQCLLRLVVAVVSMACGGIGYFWCMAGKKQTWQDLASGTRIVVHPKRN